MSSFTISGKISIIEFEYFILKDKGEKYFFILEDVKDRYKVNSRLIKKAKVYIKSPTWVEIHEITRLSSKKNPYLKRYEVDENKNKDVKLKYLCLKIEDFDGKIYYIDDDFIDNINPDLALFILREINKISFDLGAYDSMTKEEEKKLAYACYSYYSAIEKSKRGKKGINIPLPPAIIVLKKICEMLSCTPDQARSISKRDIDALFIADEQYGICKDPAAIGMGKPKNFRNK